MDVIFIWIGCDMESSA